MLNELQYGRGQTNDCPIEIPQTKLQWKNVCKFKLAIMRALFLSGDIICFHNYRVMHGRKGYRQVEPGDRHLQGAFLDWDEMYCKRRVLQMMLNVD